jgi:ABC-type phosphate/phosphonate transport system substrate-binding protein
MNDDTLIMGAVAYDPKVVTIWEGFKVWLDRRGLPFDYVLYSNYERLVDGLLAGHVHAAWNSPLAWLEAERGARARGRVARAVCMRDTDRDLTSVVVVRADSPAKTVADLRGKVVAVGASDSPQATLIPLGHLRRAGLDPKRDLTVQRHEVLVGKHGDHVGGERDAARALIEKRADAACLIDANHLAFAKDGTLPPGSTRVLAQTGKYDHCNMTVLEGVAEPLVARFVEALLSMRYDDPEVRPLLDLEGLKVWLPGRTSGYALLDEAAEATEWIDGWLQRS